MISPSLGCVSYRYCTEADVVYRYRISLYQSMGKLMRCTLCSTQFQPVPEIVLSWAGDLLTRRCQ